MCPRLREITVDGAIGRDHYIVERYTVKTDSEGKKLYHGVLVPSRVGHWWPFLITFQSLGCQKRQTFRGLQIYTEGIIEGRKESLVGTAREGHPNRAFEHIQKKVQEAAAGLGILIEVPEQVHTRATEWEGKRTRVRKGERTTKNAIRGIPLGEGKEGGRVAPRCQ